MLNGTRGIIDDWKTYIKCINYLPRTAQFLPPSLSHFHVCSPVLPSHSHSSLGSPSPSVRAPSKEEIESDTLALLLLRFCTAVIGIVRIAQSRYLTSVLFLFLFPCMHFQLLMLSLRSQLRVSVVPGSYHGHSWLKLANKIPFRTDCRRSLLGTCVVCFLDLCAVFNPVNCPPFSPSLFLAHSLSLFMLSIPCYLYPSAWSLSVPVAQSQRTVHGAQVSKTELTETDRFQSSARQREAQPWIQYF